MLPDEIQDKIYRPSEGEAYNVELDMTKPQEFHGNIEVEEE